MKQKAEIKNIIFDFGGVIINIDYQMTVAAFKQLGILNFEEQFSKLRQSHLFDELEKGIITSIEFFERIRKITDVPVTDRQITEAWNAILLDLPKQNIDFLVSLKSKYRLFLLSNTNEIHESAFMKMIEEKFGEDVLKKIFERVYLSHHLKRRKPDPEIFRHVVNENNLVAEETLFVDDSPQHIEGAKVAGLQTFYFEKGKTLQDIFLT